jgi:hypothetical protein
MAEHVQPNSVKLLFVAEILALKVLGIGPIFCEVDFKTTSILEVIVDGKLDVS